MKLAFVDNFSVRGGIARFSILLCRSLLKNYPDLHIDYFANFENLKYTPEIYSLGERVNVHLLKTTAPKSVARRIAQKLVPKLAQTSYHYAEVMQEISTIIDQRFDVAYFPSAHMMKRPDIKIPVVGTIHDFNWKYFFGQQTFPLPFVEMMEGEILKWLNNGYNVSSSHDVVNEAKKLYPGTKHLPYVVPIGSVVVHREIDAAKSKSVLEKLGINFPYLIFPGNFFAHKNHLNLFTAFALLKQRPGFEDLKLLLTGLNSDQVPKAVAGIRGIQIITPNSKDQQGDIIGMGYQPNENIDVLIANARLLVSPSIYEAICTPGMDAWNFGTPTAISDIPPFREHESVWGIRSAFFKPHDPHHMADVLEAYLNNYEQAKQDGLISQQNLAKYSWDLVAEGYMKVFQKSITDFAKN